MILKSEEILDIIEQYRPVVEEARKYREFERGNCEIKKKKDNKLGLASNKVAVNFARKIKANINGYFFGIPFQIVHKTDEKLQEFFGELFTYNNKDYLITRLGEELIDVGKAYWLLYIDQEGWLKILPVPLEEIILIKNGRYTDEVDIAIRYYYIEDRVNNKDILHVEVYTKEEVYFYVESDNGELIMDYSRKNNPAKHIFGHVPVIEFENNNGQSEYVDIYDLSNLYNKLFNSGADETEDIRNAYLKVVNASLDEKTLSRIAKTRIIQIESDNENPADVSFLTKNVSTTSFENYLALIRSLIFEIACVPDTLNLTQRTQELSARAMKQLLRELENKCVIKERNLTNSLFHFLRVIRRYVVLKTGKNYKLSDWDIQFVRNTPTTLTLETIDDFVKLKETGLFDNETLLSFLPFVRDPQNILEKKKIQDAEEMGIDYLNFHMEA